ncbi:hypothetical protein GCM10010524_42990 [Streptomyces mexicanus]
MRWQLRRVVEGCAATKFGPPARQAGYTNVLEGGWAMTLRLQRMTLLSELDCGTDLLLLRTAALAQYEQTLGDTHLQTLTSRNNLAYAYRAAQAVQQRSTATSTAAAEGQQPSTAD